MRARALHSPRRVGARDLLSGALTERCENGERDAQQRETPNETSKRCGNRWRTI
jgi:hypothetical protein